jgi:hypothetical protein
VAQQPKPKLPPVKPQVMAQQTSEQAPRRPRIFAEVSRPKKGMAEEQLGERSLDEVILSYLAEDLQED